MKNFLIKLQKAFIEKVVLPRLVEMAVNDELPLDMTELNYGHFEGGCKKFAKENSPKLTKKVQDCCARAFCSGSGEYNGLYKRLENSDETITLWQPLEDESVEKVAEYAEDLYNDFSRTLNDWKTV